MDKLEKEARSVAAGMIAAYRSMSIEKDVLRRLEFAGQACARNSVDFLLNGHADLAKEYARASKLIEARVERLQADRARTLRREIEDLRARGAMA